MKLGVKKVLLTAVTGFLVFLFARQVLAVEFGLGTLGTTSTQNVDLSLYVRTLYRWGVGIAGVLAVGMIAAGGIMYSVSGVVNTKSDALDRIKSAIYGLALLLGATLILNTINPQITSLKLPSAGKNLESKRECGPGEDPGRDKCVILKASSPGGDKPANCAEVAKSCQRVLEIPGEEGGKKPCEVFRHNTLDESASKKYNTTAEYCADKLQIVADRGKAPEGYTNVIRCEKLSDGESERIVVIEICRALSEGAVPEKKFLFAPAYPKGGGSATCVQYGVMELENRDDVIKNNYEEKWKYNKLRDVGKNYLAC